MKKPPAPAAHSARTITVLCVDPVREDHAALEAIFRGSPWIFCPDSIWALRACESLRSASILLCSGQFPLILCEYDLRPGTWRELLALVEPLPDPPLVIVTSRVADERLWAEALNLGAYDVLAKPFDRTEVTRVLSMAWMHWTDQYRGGGTPKRVAAGGAL